MPRKRNHASLTTIAEAVGLAVSTVSLAMRAHPSIPKKTQDRVLAEAKRQGYVRDVKISTMMSYMRKASVHRDDFVLAYVYNTGTRDFITKSHSTQQTWRGICTRAESLGYKVEAFWLGDKELTLPALRRILSHRSIHGMIIDSLNGMPFDFDFDGFAAATLNQTVVEAPIHRVGIDLPRSVYRLCENLARAGLNRIALVLPDELLERARFSLCAGFYTFQQSESARGAVLPVLELSGEGKDSRDKLATYQSSHKPHVYLNAQSYFYQLFPEVIGRTKKGPYWVDLDSNSDDAEVAGLDQRREEVGSMAVDLIDAHLIRNDMGLPRFSKRSLVLGEWSPGASCPVEIEEIN